MAKRNVDVIIRARDEASRKFRQVGVSALGMGAMIRRAAGIAAVYFGGREMIRGISRSLELYGQQEMALRKLSAALDLIGKGTQIKDMADFASQIQKMTTYGDELILEVMALGSAMGKLSGQDLKDATKAAIGLSKAYGLELTAAMRLVARARVGDTTTLARYGIKLKEGLSTQQKFNQVIEIGARNFSLAEAEIGTYSGKLAKMKNVMGDLAENVGGVFAPVLGAAFEWITKTVEDNSEATTKLAKIMSRVAYTYGVIYTHLGAAGSLAWDIVRLAAVGYYEDTKHFFEVALPAYLAWFGDNWKNVFLDAWNYQKTITLNMYDNLVNFFQAVWAYMNGEEFDFKWTPLLEGFESTLSELPKIADRELTKLERELEDRIAENKLLLQLLFGPGNLPAGGGGNQPEDNNGSGSAGGITRIKGGGGFGKMEAGRFALYREGMNPQLSLASQQLAQSRQQTQQLNKVAAGVQQMVINLQRMQQGLAPLKLTRF